MEYEYEMLKVGDADAIIIRHFEGQTPYVILIDAGNVNDGSKIKAHLNKYFGSCHIDLAICTHPDDDHKGGFFTLLQDEDVDIEQFWLTDPVHYIDVDDIKRYRSKENAEKAVQRIWNSHDDKLNLIKLALDKCDIVRSVVAGAKHDKFPIDIVAPMGKDYSEVVKEMVEKYGVETYDDSSKEAYDEAFKIEDNEIKSVIDVEDDKSPFNASSLVVLYHPGNKKYLFCGDANTASLSKMLQQYPKIRNVDMLKVPHHGSKRNLNTSIIEALAPKKSFISAAGNSKHPSGRLVYWLAKYGPVFSTHTANGFIHYETNGLKRQGTKTLAPLKEKTE